MPPRGRSARLCGSSLRRLVRVCFGPLDVLLSPVTAPRYAATVPGAELMPLAGCGHVPMVDDP